MGPPAGITHSSGISSQVSAETLPFYNSFLRPPSGFMPSMRLSKRICALLLGTILSSAQPLSAQSQLVWFAPLPPGIWPDGHSGATDYMDLFTPAAPWTNASSHVQVFKIYNSSFDGGLPGSLSDYQWQQVFADLARRNIALAVEWGPLNARGCGAGVEGFEGDGAGYLAARIRSL